MRAQLDPALSDAEKDKLRPPGPLSGRRKSVRVAFPAQPAAMPCIRAVRNVRGPNARLTIVRPISISSVDGDIILNQLQILVTD